MKYYNARMSVRPSLSGKNQLSDENGKGVVGDGVVWMGWLGVSVERKGGDAKMCFSVRHAYC